MTARGRRLAAALLVLASSWPAAAGLEGQRLKVEGRWNGVVFEVTDYSLRDRSKNTARGTIEGRVDAIDPANRTFTVGPVVVHWGAETKFEGIEPRQIDVGVGVSVRGTMTSPRHIEAEVVEAEDAEPGEYELIGAVRAFRRKAGGVDRFEILGVPIVLYRYTLSRARTLARHPDDRRPDEQLSFRIFGRPLIFGGEVGTRARFRDNFDLDGERSRERYDADPEVQLEFLFSATERMVLFLEAKGQAEGEFRSGDDEVEFDSEARRGESWLLVGPFWNRLSFQLGRQNFRDDREWWWDEDLDALRVHVESLRTHLQLGVARELGPVTLDGAPIDPEDDDITRVLAQFSWRGGSSVGWDLFGLRHDDRSGMPPMGAAFDEDDLDREDITATWFGARFFGRQSLGAAGDVHFRVDVAGVEGTVRRAEVETVDDDDEDIVEVVDVVRADLSGTAFDASVSFETELAGRPTLTLGYARGSGDDDPSDTDEKAFRQTGLHDNNAKFRGVDRFRMYGEALRPELSNLEIVTLALGFHLAEEISVEILRHGYRQVEPSVQLAPARIRAALTGLDDDVGEEWNLVVGIEPWTHLELELVLGRFQAGRAFGPRENEAADLAIFKLDFNF